MPDAASSSATAANADSNAIMNRRSATDCPSRSSIVENLTGTSPSSDAIAARSAGVRDSTLSRRAAPRTACVREKPAAQQTNSHHLEVARRHDAVSRVTLLVRRRDVSLEIEPAAGSNRFTERQRIDGAGGFDAGQRAEPFDQLPVE